MKKLDLPKHRNPSETRVATAAYNFVPLPDVVVRSEPLPDHDVYQTLRKTGYFDIKLTTHSPLYIRGLLATTQFARQENNQYEDGKDIPSQNVEFGRLVKNIPYFFHINDKNEPVIPGSSLRGMLRQLIEVVTYSKLSQLSDKQMFFRTMDDTALGLYYRGRMTNQNLRAGYLRKEDDNYFIYPCSMIRIARNYLGGPQEFYEGKTPNQTPKWEGKHHQYQDIWIRLEKNILTQPPEFQEPHNLDGWVKANLVITGNMNDKKAEFAFYGLNEPQKILVSSEKIQRFHDDDQITQWQSKAFPKDKPQKNCRNRAGMLRSNLRNEGEPVFYLLENDELTFFGRAHMFRLPYNNRLIDLVPKELCNSSETATVDIADGLFGYVNGQGTCAGRVFVTEAVLENGSRGEFDGVKIPKILSTPRPTSFQNYLTQKSDHKDNLLHYDSNESEKYDKTVIRGHKFYWHQADSSYEATENVNSNSTQHTKINPLRSNHTFSFRVYFENLTDVELGALAWVLTLCDSGNYAYKLGMGKSLGLGSVKFRDVELKLSCANKRYSQLFTDSGCWNTGLLEKAEESNYFIEKFEDYMCTELEEKQGKFKGIERIRMLLAMLSYPGPNADKTKQMNLNQFKYRPILPDPLMLDGISREPDRSETRQTSTKNVPKTPPMSSSQRPRADIPEVRANVAPLANDILAHLANANKEDNIRNPTKQKKRKK